MKNLLVKPILMLLLFVSFSSKANSTYSDAPEALYKHLGKHIKYPSKATAQHLQGHSIVLFSVADGKISDIKVDTELGGDCDGEVINRLLSFDGYSDVKPGKYALKTTFKLSEAKTAIKNESVTTPKGYQKMELTIVGFAPEPVTVIGYGQKATTKGDVIGVTIKPTTGNETKELRIIGDGNWAKDKAPLFILDGKTIDNDTFKSIDPNTIESMSVLKDASATSIYGTPGANGVIIIASKYKPGVNGDVLGVTVKPLNGTESTGLTIRGSGNWDKEKAPLVILDGKTIDNDALKIIDPNTIESISVIKDATATSQYGTSANNGVIIVTTKVKDNKKSQN